MEGLTLTHPFHSGRQLCRHAWGRESRERVRGQEAGQARHPQCWLVALLAGFMETIPQQLQRLG